jgi:hypothetical protein
MIFGDLTSSDRQQLHTSAVELVVGAYDSEAALLRRCPEGRCHLLHRLPDIGFDRSFELLCGRK